MSCMCQACGRDYKMDLIIPDKMWEKIKPYSASKGGGLLCPSCIVLMLEKRMGYSALYLIKPVKEILSPPPQKSITINERKEIEEIRLKLHEILQDSEYMLPIINNVTGRLWKIAHRKV